MSLSADYRNIGIDQGTPLCPSCVAEHTQQDYKLCHKPTYVNLNEIFYEVKERCYGNIVSLQEFNHKNVECQFVRKVE